MSTGPTKVPWLPDRAYCNVLDAASDGVSSLPVFEVPDSAKHFLEAGVHRLVNTGEPGLLFLHAASNNGTPELQELLNGFDRTAFKHVGLDDWKQQLSREQDPEVVKWLAEGARAPKNGGNEEKFSVLRVQRLLLASSPCQDLPIMKVLQAGKKTTFFKTSCPHNFPGGSAVTIHGVHGALDGTHVIEGSQDACTLYVRGLQHLKDWSWSDKTGAFASGRLVVDKSKTLYHVWVHCSTETPTSVSNGDGFDRMPAIGCRPSQRGSDCQSTVYRSADSRSDPSVEDPEEGQRPGDGVGRQSWPSDRRESPLQAVDGDGLEPMHCSTAPSLPSASVRDGCREKGPESRALWMQESPDAMEQALSSGVGIRPTLNTPYGNTATRCERVRGTARQVRQDDDDTLYRTSGPSAVQSKGKISESFCPAKAGRHAEQGFGPDSRGLYGAKTEGMTLQVGNEHWSGGPQQTILQGPQTPSPHFPDHSEMMDSGDMSTKMHMPRSAGVQVAGFNTEEILWSSRDKTQSSTASAVCGDTSRKGPVESGEGCGGNARYSGQQRLAYGCNISPGGTGVDRQAGSGHSPVTVDLESSTSTRWGAVGAWGMNQGDVQRRYTIPLSPSGGPSDLQEKVDSDPPPASSSSHMQSFAASPASLTWSSSPWPGVDERREAALGSNVVTDTGRSFGRSVSHSRGAASSAGSWCTGGQNEHVHEEVSSLAGEQAQTGAANHAWAHVASTRPRAVGKEYAKAIWLSGKKAESSTSSDWAPAAQLESVEPQREHLPLSQSQPNTSSYQCYPPIGEDPLHRQSALRSGCDSGRNMAPQTARPAYLHDGSMTWDSACSVHADPSIIVRSGMQHQYCREHEASPSTGDMSGAWSGSGGHLGRAAPTHGSVTAPASGPSGSDEPLTHGGSQHQFTKFGEAAVRPGHSPRGMVGMHDRHPLGSLRQADVCQNTTEIQLQRQQVESVALGMGREHVLAAVQYFSPCIAEAVDKAVESTVEDTVESVKPYVTVNWRQISKSLCEQLEGAVPSALEQHGDSVYLNSEKLGKPVFDAIASLPLHEGLVRALLPATMAELKLVDKSHRMQLTVESLQDGQLLHESSPDMGHAKSFLQMSCEEASVHMARTIHPKAHDRLMAALAEELGLEKLLFILLQELDRGSAWSAMRAALTDSGPLGLETLDHTGESSGTEWQGQGMARPTGAAWPTGYLEGTNSGYGPGSAGVQGFIPEPARSMGFQAVSSASDTRAVATPPVPSRAGERFCEQQFPQGTNLMVVGPLTSTTSYTTQSVRHLLTTQPQARIVYIAPDLIHAKQQATTLQSCQFVSERWPVEALTAKRMTAEKWQAHFSGHSVLTMTAQVLLNSLDQNWVYWSHIQMLVLDKCLCALGEHPYVKLVREYKAFSEGTKPQVLATASSIFQPGSQEVENQALKQLIGQLQARVLCLSEDNTEVDRTDPGNNVLSADFSAQKVMWSVCSRSEDRDFSMQMGQFMISAFEKYKEIRQDPELKGFPPVPTTMHVARGETSPQVDEWVIKSMEKVNECKLIPEHASDLRACIDLLSKLNYSLLIVAEVGYELAQNYIKESVSKAEASSKPLIGTCYEVCWLSHMLHTLSTALQVRNDGLDGIGFPKLLRLVEALNSYKHQQTFHAIVSVRTRHGAQMVETVLRGVPSLEFLTFCMIWGRSKVKVRGILSPEIARGMTKSSQIAALEQFKGSSHALLVATGVTEEVIDGIPCDLVVVYSAVDMDRYQHMSMTAGRVIALMQETPGIGAISMQ